jgi:hypothetical protein
MVKARRITGLLLVWTAPDETLNQTVSLPRCSLRGRSGARHARGAARGSAPPIPYAARRGHCSPGRDGKAGSYIIDRTGKRRSPWCCLAPPVMHFLSGQPMHLLSGVDTQTERGA